MKFSIHPHVSIHSSAVFRLQTSATVTLERVVATGRHWAAIALPAATGQPAGAAAQRRQPSSLAGNVLPAVDPHVSQLALCRACCQNVCYKLRHCRPLSLLPMTAVPDGHVKGFNREIVCQDQRFSYLHPITVSPDDRKHDFSSFGTSAGTAPAGRHQQRVPVPAPAGGHRAQRRRGGDGDGGRGCCAGAGGAGGVVSQSRRAEAVGRHLCTRYASHR